MLSKAYGVEAMKNSMFLSGTNNPKRVMRTWEMLKTKLITFFDIKSNVHF
jgi:hypothetical protein